VLIATVAGMFALLMVSFTFVEGGAAELRVPGPTDYEDEVRGEGQGIGPSQVMVTLTSDAAVP